MIISSNDGQVWPSGCDCFDIQEYYKLGSQLVTRVKSVIEIQTLNYFPMRFYEIHIIGGGVIKKGYIYTYEKKC